MPDRPKRCYRCGHDEPTIQLEDGRWCCEICRCPFCGGEADTASNGCGGHLVLCTDCCTASGPWPSEQAAIAAWNRRTPSNGLTVLGELRKRLRKAGPHVPDGWWVWSEIDAIAARLKGESDE